MGFKGRHVGHSCKSQEHYTPAPYVKAARLVLGAIDLDPASCARANATVKAARYYTAKDDGLAQPWCGRVYLNPPGDRFGRLVKEFWRKACEHALFGGPDAAVIWAGYSLGPIPRLEACEPFEDGTRCPGPGDWPWLFVGKGAPCATGSGRIKWINGETGEPGEQPGHGNYFCLLGGDDALRARFRERFGAFGRVRVPARLPQRARDLGAEVCVALAASAPASMSKSALAKVISARKGDTMRAIDRLAAAGAVVADGRRWVLAPRENGQRPLTSGSPGSGTVFHEGA